jgi:hypothetical protein
LRFAVVGEQSCFNVLATHLATHPARSGTA